MGTLTVHVLDEDQNPVAGKKVFCLFPATFLGMLDTHSDEYTDDDGVAEFDEVPVCTAQVYVDGELRLEVGVGVGEYKDVTITL